MDPVSNLELSNFAIMPSNCFLLCRYFTPTCLFPPATLIGGIFSSGIYIIKEKLETLSAMESYLPTSDRHAASWIFSDGPSKQLGVVKLRYNALKFFLNVNILRQRACFRQRLSLAAFSQAARQLRSLNFDHSASTSVEISTW